MIVITAPTSTIGRQVIRRLLGTEKPLSGTGEPLSGTGEPLSGTGEPLSGTGEPLPGTSEPLRVVVRDPARLDPEVADRVEVVVGSHGDPEVVAKALAGADALFWLVPADPAAKSPDAAYSGFAAPAIEALRASGGGIHVVGISALGRGTAPAGRAGHITATLAMDDRIAATGVPYRALTLPSFMENILRQAVPIAQRGVLSGMYAPDKPLPLVATRDIAAVAARLLRDRGWSGYEEVPVMAPERLTHLEVAEILTEVLGRPVRYEQTTPEANVAAAMGRGFSEAMARSWVAMALAKNDGLDDGSARTGEGSPGTTLREWCTTVLSPAVARAVES